MAEKLKFMVFRVLFLFNFDFWQGETLPGVLLKERKHFKIKKSTMAVKKCKIILLQAALKDFWSSVNIKKN